MISKEEIAFAISVQIVRYTSGNSIPDEVIFEEAQDWMLPGRMLEAQVILDLIKQRIEPIKSILEEIEKLGHSHGHGRGYTCANMAQQALEKLNCLNTNPTNSKNSIE